MKAIFNRKFGALHPVVRSARLRRMANNDRVTELYYGQISSTQNQQLCRDRIHWMCGQITGERVLDIGCSQGIASILAAREGHRVVGVDVEQPSIEFARAELAKEPAVVQERVNLVLADIFDQRANVEQFSGLFNTVLLGEILEHQTKPRRLVEVACQYLAPGGRLVIAVPFGLHLHDDHKYTFYLSDILETLDGLCTLFSLDIVGGYIHVTAGPNSDAEQPRLTSFEQLLAMSERMFLERELRMNKSLHDRGKLNKKLQQKETRLKTQNDELRDQIASLSREVQAEQAQILRLISERDRLKEALKSKNLELNAEQKRAEQALLANRSTFDRGLQALSSTVDLEIRSGRVLKEPMVSVQKTLARVGRILRNRPVTGASSR